MSWLRSARAIALLASIVAAPIAARAQDEAPPATPTDAPTAPTTDGDPAAEAERLNEEGKAEFAKGDAAGDEAEKQGHYAEAFRKFDAAARRSPQGRYFFNKCFALSQLGRYPEAIRACEQVRGAGADDKLIEKTDKALAGLRQKVDGGGAGDGQGGGGGEPVEGDPFAARPSDEYQWALGLELGLVGSTFGLDPDTEAELYAPTGPHVRVYGDFIVNQAAKLGVQASLGFTNLATGDDNAFDDQLRIVDLGGALFIQRRRFGHLYVKPLLGVHLSAQQPDTQTEAFIAIGGRAEVALAYAFGPRQEHAITVAPAINLYGPASGQVDGLEPVDFGLDKSSVTFSLGVGYQFRFATPFGMAPLISLE